MRRAEKKNVMRLKDERGNRKDDEERIKQEQKSEKRNEIKKKEQGRTKTINTPFLWTQQVI